MSRGAAIGRGELAEPREDRGRADDRSAGSSLGRRQRHARYPKPPSQLWRNRDSRRTRCVDQRLAEHADPFPEEFGALRIQLRIAWVRMVTMIGPGPGESRRAYEAHPTFEQ